MIMWNLPGAASTGFLGSGGKVLKHHMELRGLGIINIKELFGISATSVSKIVDFAVRLERWNPDADYDRLGLDQDTHRISGSFHPVDCHAGGAGKKRRHAGGSGGPDSFIAPARLSTIKIDE